MANERRIDDHSFWGGAKPKGATFPDGSKMKSIKEVEGAGACKYYPDTEKEIADVQMKQVGKIEKNKVKEGYRN